MMTAQYYQLVQVLDVILQKTNNLHGLRALYSVAKKSANRTEKEDLGLLESLAKLLFRQVISMGFI